MRVRRLKKLPFDLFVDIDEDYGSTDKDGEPMVKKAMLDGPIQFNISKKLGVEL